MADESNFVQVSDRVSESLARPISVEGRALSITTCIGIAQATPDDDVDSLYAESGGTLIC